MYINYEYGASHFMNLEWIFQLSVCISNLCTFAAFWIEKII